MSLFLIGSADGYSSVTYAAFGSMYVLGEAPLLGKALEPRERAGSSCRCYIELIHRESRSEQAEPFFDRQLAQRRDLGL